jgi:hypothetical protein
VKLTIARHQVDQLGVSKDEAEEALKAENGDLVKALIRLVKPKPRAKSVDGGAVTRS